MFKNTLNLTRFYLLRNKNSAIIWLVSMTLLNFYVAFMYNNLYGTQAERDTMYVVMQNPAMVAMLGPTKLVDGLYTLPAMFSQQMLVICAIALGIMNILYVIKSTRKSEEDGQLEVISSLSIGRLSNLSATYLSMVVINIIIALVSGILLYVSGMQDITISSALTYTFTIGLVAIIYGFIAGVFAQLCQTSRMALILSSVILLLDYMIRAWQDINNVSPAFTPLGLGFHALPMVNLQALNLVILFIIALVFEVISLLLNKSRDHDSGILPTRDGKASASNLLRSPLTLILRLQRTTIIAWIVILFILGATYGSIFGDLDSFIDGNELLTQMFLRDGTNNLAQSFASIIIMIASIGVTFGSLTFIFKIVNEEKSDRIDLVYSKPISRYGYLKDYLVIAIILAIIYQLSFMLGLYIVQASVLATPLLFKDLLINAMLYLFPIYFFTGLGLLLIGIFPKGRVILYGIIIFFAYFVYFGSIMNVPQVLVDYSPFAIVPHYPVQSINWLPLLIMLGLGILTGILGFITYRKRDIKSN